MQWHRPLTLKADQSEGGAPAGGDDVAHVLKEFESGLESLRALYEQRQALQRLLKQRESDLAQRDTALALKDEALAQRNRLLDQQGKDLAELTEQFDSHVKDVERSKQQVSEREELLAKRLQDVARQQAELAERQEQLARDADAQAALAQEHEESVRGANAEIDRIRAEIRAQRDELTARGQELEARAQELSRQQAELEAARKQTAEQARQVAEDRRVVGEERVRCEQAARDAGTATRRAQQLEVQLGELQQRLNGVEQRARTESEAAAGARKQADELEQQIAALWKTLEEEQAGAKKADEAYRQELNTVRSEHEARLAEAARTGQESARKHQEAAADIERQWKQRLDQALVRERESSAAAIREAESKVEAARAQHAAVLDEKTRSLRSEVEATVAGLRSEYEQRMQRELASQQKELLGASAQGVEQAVEAAQQRAEKEWQARLAESITQQQDEHRREVEKVALEAKRRLGEIELRYARELEERVAAARSEGHQSSAGDWQARLDEALAGERARLSAHIAEVVSASADSMQSSGLDIEESMESLRAAGSAGDVDAAVEALTRALQHVATDRTTLESKLTETRGYLDEAAEIIKSLEKQVQDQRVARRADAASAEGADAGMFISMELRRRRLKLMRAILKDRTEKVRKGSEALRRRYEQCEIVLRQRADLAAVRERVVEAERKIERSTARSKVGVIMLCAVATIGLLGGMSWALARQVAPATFVATAQLAADGRGRPLAEGEKLEWQAYHEKLMNDPRFHQMAAERFQRLGMESLATPADVKRLIDSRLHAECMNPGEMSLHMEGQGGRNTERTLNTFAAAFASHANSALTARTDGGVTRITQEARTGDEPIDNTRTYWALGMMGIGVSVCFFVATALWRKLAGAKTAFEQDTQIASMLDESRWSTIKDPELEAVLKPRGKAA